MLYYIYPVAAGFVLGARFPGSSSSIAGNKYEEGITVPEFLITDERASIVGNLIVRLPEIRRRVGISQEELGRKIGKSRQKVSDIERLTAPMGWDTYIATCIALEHAGAFDEAEDQWYFENKKKWFD